MRSKFSIQRRDNHSLGITLGRYTGVKTKVGLDGSVPSESEKPNFRFPFITSGTSEFSLLTILNPGFQLSKTP